MYLKTPIPQQSKLVFCAELGMDAPELAGVKIRIGDDFIAVPNAVDRLVCKHTDLDSVDETHTFALDGHVVYQNDDCAVEMYMDNYLSADETAEEHPDLEARLDRALWQSMEAISGVRK